MADTIEVMLIRQLADQNADCRWVSTAIMIADCLTKAMESTFLRNVLQLGRFRIYDEQRTLQANANRKFGQRWISLDSSADSKRENNECESYDHPIDSINLESDHQR